MGKVSLCHMLQSLFEVIVEIEMIVIVCVQCLVTHSITHTRQKHHSLRRHTALLQNISRYSKAFLRLLSSNRSGVVKINEFAVFPML